MYSKDNVLSMLRKVNDHFPVDSPQGDVNYGMNWTNESWNLGDTTLLTIIPLKAHETNRSMFIYNESGFFAPLMIYNEYYRELSTPDLTQFNNLFVLKPFDFGAGHWLQFQCRGMGLDIDIKPKPYINCKKEKKKNTVLINIEGHSFNYLTEAVAPIIQKFVDENNNSYQFVETFAKQNYPHLKNVNSFRVPIGELIPIMAEFEYFIGLDSGLMHLAAALDIKSVIITDGPKIDRFYLPKPNSNHSDLIHMDYPYPQNVHLYPNGENELVKQLSVDNLKKALEGEIYPYWKEDYLDLILEI